MGGNLRVHGIGPSLIETKTTDMKSFVWSIRNLLRSIDEKFSDGDESRMIWPRGIENYIAGSFSHFASADRMHLQSLSEIIPSINDIDVLVNRDCFVHFCQFICMNETFGLFEKIGQSSSKTSQLSVMFKIPNDRPGPDHFFVQVDFIAADFENDLPTEWERFAHSSSIDDLKLGIKGVFHKLLLGSIDFAGKHQAYLIERSETKNAFAKLTKIHDHAFSVLHGVRKKYQQETSIGGIPMVRALKKPEYVYVNDVPSIIKILFGLDDFPTQDQIYTCHSFVGLTKAIKHTFNSNRIGRLHILEAFTDRIFGFRAQKLNNDLTKDREIKFRALNYLISELKMDDSCRTEMNEEVAKKFYEKYFQTAG